MLLGIGLGATSLSGGDRVAPILSDATGIQNVSDQTKADISVSTNDDSGALYWIVTSHGTPPTAEQVKAGNTAGGTAASDSGSVAVTAVGTQNIVVADAPTGGIFAHFVQTDTAGNNSNVATTDQWIQEAPA